MSFPRLRSSLRASRAKVALDAQSGFTGMTVDELWPLGEIKLMDPGGDVCETHSWGHEVFFKHGAVVIRGCDVCSAVQRVDPVPDPTDREALERWLNT